MRNLLDLETSTDHGSNNYESLSRKWVLVISLTSATAIVAIAVAVFLLLWIHCGGARHKRRLCSKSGMLVWTNQLSTMQNPEFSGSENNSRWESARFETVAKVAPRRCHMWSGAGVVVVKRPSRSSVSPGVPCAPMPYTMLQAATHNFSTSNLLGEGSFGLVYKAKLVGGGGGGDDDVVNAAVKRLRLGAGSAKNSFKEFQGEVDLMSKIRHPNLVTLLGYSSDGTEPLVVYELMQNGSLHDQLHGPKSCRVDLTWGLRLKIALEAARGLEHLHENCKPPAIHRDFKASNILLDACFNAKVSDFGLAVVLEEGGLLRDDVQVQGTFGYIAPEYLMDGTLTEKSDVYGFGVVLLELLTGRLPIDTSLPPGSQSLVTWATPLLTTRAKWMEALDPGLRDSVNEKHLLQVAAVAVLCVQAEPSYRPLIADVVQSLLPLVPQELGGALRDPKPKQMCLENDNNKNSSSSQISLERDSELGVEAGELPSCHHSHRSDCSFCSVSDGQSESRFPRSSNDTSLRRSQSWEDATRSYLERQHSCAGQCS